MREVGSYGPDFALPCHDNGYTKLSRFLERNDYVVVVYFLVAGSPGCARELGGFRDLYEEYKKRRIAIIGISPDPVSALAQFAKELDVPFDLCSDADHRIAEEWGTWSEGRQMRATFVLDDRGTIRHAFPRVNVNSHPSELLALLSAEIGEPAAEAAPAPAPAQEAAQASAAAQEAAAPIHAQAPAIAPAVPASGLSANDVVFAFARTSLHLLQAHVQAGGQLPQDLHDAAARLAAHSK